jgi:hypothetical protein
MAALPVAADRQAWSAVPTAVREATSPKRAETRLRLARATRDASWATPARATAPNTKPSFSNAAPPSSLSLSLKPLTAKVNTSTTSSMASGHSAKKASGDCPPTTTISTAIRSPISTSPSSISSPPPKTPVQLAWIAYLQRDALDKVSPVIVRRIQDEIHRRIHGLPAAHGFLVDGLRRRRPQQLDAVDRLQLLNCLLLGKTTSIRATMIHKAITPLTASWTKHPSDGGLRRGPWLLGRAGASVFDCLELLYLASNGAINVYDQP